MDIIELKDVTKMYGKNRGVKNITLSIAQGEIFGFIGPNGAGKSTTIRTMLGLLFSDSGEIAIFGLDFTKHREEILARIGYAAAEVTYYDGMKAGQFLTYAASFYQRDCTEERNRLAQLFELDLNKKIGEMSLGNKKKVAIIQAMQHQPDLLVFDEPTSGLDPLVQQHFFEELHKVKRRGGTVFFSSHILSEVEHLCDRVGVIRDGELIQVSTLFELQKSQYVHVHIKTNGDEVQLPSSFNVSDLVIENGRMQFLYQGNMNVLIQFIATLDIIDVKIQEPDLETIFMHFYDKQRDVRGEGV